MFWREILICLVVIVVCSVSIRAQNEDEVSITLDLPPGMIEPGWCGIKRHCEKHGTSAGCRDSSECTSLTRNECRPACTANTDCEGPWQVCTNGTCEAVPALGGLCGPDHGHTSCPSGQSCVYGECQFDCSSSSDCPTASRCYIGKCKQILPRKCEDDIQCLLGGEVECHKRYGDNVGLCTKTCFSNTDCTELFPVCEKGICWNNDQTPCEVDIDCPFPGQQCLKCCSEPLGVCLPACTGTGQQTCGTGTTCQEGFCRKPHGPVHAVHPHQDECNSNVDCLGTDVCIERTKTACIILCTIMGHCPTGATCSSYSCRFPHSPPELATTPEQPAPPPQSTLNLCQTTLNQHSTTNNHHPTTLHQHPIALNLHPTTNT